MPEFECDEEMIRSINEKIDTSYQSRLSELLELTIKKVEDLTELEKISKAILKNHGYYETSKHRYPDCEQYVNHQLMELRKSYAKVHEKIANSVGFIKIKSRDHRMNIKFYQAGHLMHAFENYLEINRYQKEIGEISRNSTVEGIATTFPPPPYHKVLDLIHKTERLVDEIAVYHHSNHNFERAYNYYYILGDLFIKEAFFLSQFDMAFSFIKEMVAYSLLKAGKAFYRCHHAINDVYLTTMFGPPVNPNMTSSIPDVFDIGTAMPQAQLISLKCFDQAKEYFRQVGMKQEYLECRNFQYELREERNDFEQNIVKLFHDISRSMVQSQPPFVKAVGSTGNIREEYIRDYFKSHVQVMTEEIVYAESLQTVGRTDLMISSKDHSGRIRNAISEFKIWAQVCSGDHSYKNVINQLRKYVTEFEAFGIIIMINRNKGGIKNKYIEKIIRRDRLYIDGSVVEESLPGSEFFYLKSNHKFSGNDDKEITIYHMILNVRSLLDRS